MSVNFEIDKCLKENGSIDFVAQCEDQAAGVLRMIYTTGCAYLDRIHVNPEFRSHTIGRTLLLTAENWACNEGAVSIVAVIAPDLEDDKLRLTLFFQRNGYEIDDGYIAKKELRS